YCHQSQSHCLETINLQSCIVDKLDVLEVLVEMCHKLKHLNLLDIHGSSTKSRPCETIKILSKCKTLQSLAINACCIRTHFEDCEQLLGSQFEQTPITNPLLTLVESCSYLTEFELIGQRYHYDLMFRKESPNNETRHVIPISSEQLASISQWSHLQKLTLAVHITLGRIKPNIYKSHFCPLGFRVTGSGKFLLQICQNCTELRSLSLANLKGPILSHSGNVASFNTALTHCHNLRDFRLEQPYFNITKSFLESVHNAQHLERVCWKVRNGKLAEDELEPWLD
ncbi:hypothetical protein QZH41_016703, partial [Actinostola sp. cb2023]